MYFSRDLDTADQLTDNFQMSEQSISKPLLENVGIAEKIELY